jgi:membrane-associated phospholipid phosphatase
MRALRFTIWESDPEMKRHIGRFWTLNILVLYAVFCPSIFGQHGSPAGDFLRDFAADQKRIWTSPFKMSQRQAWTLALPLVAGTVALKSTDRAAVDALPGTPAQRDWSRRVSLIGSMAGLTMATAATTGYGHFAGKPTYSHLGRDAALALASGLAVTYAIKGATWRERPDAPGSRGSFYSGGDAFPSGHALTSFAVATAVAAHPRAPKWLKISLISTAAAISISRVTGYRHWPSDVYFGAFSGILIGRGIARAPHAR